MNLVGPRPHPVSNLSLLVLVMRNTPSCGEQIPYYACARWFGPASPDGHRSATATPTISRKRSRRCGTTSTTSSTCPLARPPDPPRDGRPSSCVVENRRRKSQARAAVAATAARRRSCRPGPAAAGDRGPGAVGSRPCSHRRRWAPPPWIARPCRRPPPCRSSESRRRPGGRPGPRSAASAAG